MKKSEKRKLQQIERRIRRSKAKKLGEKIKTYYEEREIQTELARFYRDNF